MILNRGVTVEQEGEPVLFDYSAAMYPMGLNPDQLFYFHQEDIDTVVYEGYSDEEETRFASLYQKWLDSDGATMKKGKTR